jgi:hypothetical protein
MFTNVKSLHLDSFSYLIGQSLICKACHIFNRLHGGQVGLSLTISMEMLLSLISFLLFFSIIPNSNAQLNDFTQITFKSSEHKEMEAYGRIAANQIKNGSVSWIQAGLWYMTIAFNDLDNNKMHIFIQTLQW